jgi:cysteine desulfurase / selenocysteine lyase
MNELTPDLIAAIATRLYNELPGANLVPKTDAEVARAAPEALRAPAGIPSIPLGDSFPTSFLPGLPATPASSPPAAPKSADVPTESFAPAGPMQNTSSGLREFVQRVQMTGLRADSGRCADDPGQDAIRRLFTNAGAGTTTAPVNTARPFDVPAIRRDFPILNQRVHGKPLAWLDNAATTQKPQSVIDTLSRFYANDNSNIRRGAHTLAARATDEFEQARQKIQLFLGASSTNEIVYVRGATEGVNLVAQTYGRKFLQPGDEIVMTILEHHANIVPWQMIAKEKGAVIRVVPVTDRGEVMLEEYQKLLGPRTKLVALAHASNSIGTLLPIAEMTQMAKRFNARVLIDGAQSVAHVPVNMQQLDCDFYVFSGHKIFGPTGVGALYAKKELLEIMPPYQGGGNMIRDVTFEETTFNDAPAKFEAGTPNIADAVGLGTALDYVNRLGLPNISKYEHELLQYATEQLSRINGLRIIGTAREKVAVLSFVLKERPTEEVGRLLDLEGIAVRAGPHCAPPSFLRFGVESTVRPSFSSCNTFEEIDRLADAVKRILRM